VVWNLLSNAIKFTPPRGKVDISVSRGQNQVMLSVGDTGQGIRPEFLPFVFEPFRQGDTSTNRSKSGLGLGLAIVRQLVELHGGHVYARSDGEGLGARFEITLPSLDGQRKVKPMGLSGSGKRDELLLEGTKVLVVDDEPDSRMLLAELLQIHGMTVQTAGSASEALLAIDTHQPDVLLSDIGMPINDGYTLIQRIRQLPPERGGKLRAAALTGYGSDADRQRAIEAGFQAVIIKPIIPDALLENIRALLQTSVD
jgi:CheY-like chemotaxis protein